MIRYGVIFLLSMVLSACSTVTKPSDNAMHPEKIQGAIYARIYVEGLSCPFCAYGLEKKLKAIEGLLSVKIDIDDGRVDMVFGEGKRPKKGEIEHAVELAGFTAKNLRYASSPFLQ